MVMNFLNIIELLSLLVLGMGYIVLYFANREEKGLRLVGYVIGVGIITLSLIYIISSLILGTGYNRSFSHRSRENIIRRSMMHQERLRQPRMIQPSMPNTPTTPK